MKSPRPNSYASNLHRFPLRFSAHLVDPENDLDDLERIEKACFPEGMRESKKDLAEFFADDYSFGLTLRENGEAIGYLSGTYLSEENSPGILEDNAFLRENQDQVCYVENIAILKTHRSILAFDFLCHEAYALFRDLDFTHLALHARRRNAFSRLLRNRFDARVLKTYDDWLEYGEPFDYLLIDLRDKPALSMPVDFLLTVIRRARGMLKGHTWHG